MDNTAANGSQHHIIDEHYSGKEMESIDRFQAVWRRSLRYALPGTFEDRFYDILFCCREALFNAMELGCEGSPDKFCRLTAEYDEQSETLIIQVEDPGDGYPERTAEEIASLPLNSPEQRLKLIKKVCDEFSIDHNGTCVVMRFNNPANG